MTRLGEKTVETNKKKIELTERQKEAIELLIKTAKNRGLDVELSTDNRRLIWVNQDGHEIWNASTNDYL